MGDAGSLVCMFKNCREEVLACVQDEQCKAALDALAECGLNDQVTSPCCCTDVALFSFHQ